MKKQRGTPDIKILSNEVFYPYGLELDCFTKSKPESNPVSEKYTFGVQINMAPQQKDMEIISEMSDDETFRKLERTITSPLVNSVCDRLLQTFCIFCDEVHHQMPG
mmetsp:Transcript_20599/g.30188  ORF Transcript_20599/g.30188 Transcript_20599/m.30188 type:complete len:106 (-) Transcript_20599:78-395(-)